MMKKIISVLLASFMMMQGTFAFAERQTLQFLDDSDDVLQMKKNLITAGYLTDDDSTTLFDRNTKTAIETLQGDFDLEATGIATPEIQVIAMLLAKKTSAASAPQPEPTKAPVPDVEGETEAMATAMIETAGYKVVPVYEFSYIEDKGNAIRTDESNGIVQLYISRGPQEVDCDQCTWHAWYIKGSKKDVYEFNPNPYIDLEENKLYIPLKVTLNSTYKHKWRGYGNACVTDTFDKTVPIVVQYTNETITKGEETEITLVIPLQNLNVDYPTTMSVKIELYYGSKLDKEESLRMDFTFSWPDNE